MKETLKKFYILIPVLGALLFISILLIIFGTSPIEAFSAILNGAFGSQQKFLNTSAFWVPLLLASTGLLVTFSAGLWNIGIEGQIVMGALAASAVALNIEASKPVMLTLEILAAMGAGGLWAGFTALLKTKGKVNEIFGGLALTNLAIILTNYMISGPWQPPEGGTFRGTAPFASEALFPLLASSKFSPLALILSISALALVGFILSNTYFGLKLKSLGKNHYSAFLLGVSSDKEVFLSMAFCGALAGLGGAVRVLSWFDSLRQSISGGIGYLALLVVMLAAYRVILVPFIAFFFSSILTGSISLQLKTQLHSSLGGILTGVMVLFVILFGDRKKIFKKKMDQNNE
jgi:simple sugar transport system permease protein